MRSQIKNFPLREFTIDDSIAELTAILNTAYKKWEELGFKYSAATQTNEDTLKRLQGGRCFIVMDKARMVATITYHAPDKKLSQHPIYKEGGTATFGQLAVYPDYQNLGIAAALIGMVEELAKLDGAKNMTIDTAENNTWLVNYYTKKGYHIIGHVNWTVTNYKSVFLRKELSTKE